MNLTKDQKKQKSTELAEEIKSASGIFFAAYQGLKFQDLASLREKLAPTKCRFCVERNTIVEHAVKGAGIKAAPEASTFKGPTAIAIQQNGDLIEMAKVLVAFEKEFPALKIKAGYSSDTWFNVNECKKLASLGTRPEMLAQLAGSLYGCVSQIAGVLQAPMRDLAYALKAVEEKKNSATAA